MWLYDDPARTGPLSRLRCAHSSQKASYVPRSIFRQKPPEPPAPAEPAATATGKREDTVEELREKLKEFVQTIMAVLQPYTDAYQAVLECCRQHSTVTTPPLKFAT